MSVLFCPISLGALKKIDSNLSDNKIKLNQPITIEYKKIRIVSKYFNDVFANKIMVVNSIKNNVTKNAASDSITYYDDKASLIKLNKKKCFDINQFDASKYCNPICYYCQAYNSEVITVTTKFYKINFETNIDKILNYMQNIISVGSIVPNYGVYFSVASDSISEISSIISDLNDGIDLLVKHHTLVLRNDDINVPLVVGNYICFPEIDDDNEINRIIENYTVVDYKLVGKDINGTIIEYPDSYFILHIDNQYRNDLNDFDFASSSNDLLVSLKNGEQTALDKIVSALGDSSNLNYIQNIINEYNSNPDSFTSIQNMYGSLSSDAQKWFSTAFPQIVSKF